MISWLRMISNGFHFFSKGQYSVTGTSNLIKLSGITNLYAFTVYAELWTSAVSHIIPWVRVMVRVGVTCPTTAVSSISRIAATLSRLLTLVLTLLQLETQRMNKPSSLSLTSLKLFLFIELKVVHGKQSILHTAKKIGVT